MEAFLEENWIGLLTLIVAIATFFVSWSTLKYSRNRDKKHIQSLIKSKQAQLEELESYKRSGFSLSAMENINGNISSLKADIKQLKEEL